MNGSHGALRMIELAAVRLTAEVGTLVDAVEHQLGSERHDELRQSAHALTTRLRLLLSAMTPARDAIAAGRLVDLAQGLPGYVQLDHAALDPAANFEAPLGRILLNSLLLAADSLPKGGTIRLAGGAGDVFIQIDGPNAAWPAGTAVCVTDPAEAHQALQAWQAPRMALTAVLAHVSGIRLSMVFSPHPGLYPPILRLGGA